MDSNDETGRFSRRTVLGGMLVGGGLGIGGAALLSRESDSEGGRVMAQTTGDTNTTITASPATPETENATYTLTIRNITANGGRSSVDQVALDFRGTGMNFNTVDRTDITLIKNPQTEATPLVVTKTRTALSGNQPTIGISRASGQPRVTEGDTLQVRIPGLTNPQQPAQYVIGIQLNELATGERAGVLDSRIGQFVIRGETGTVSGTITADDEPVTTPVTFTDATGQVLGTATPDSSGTFNLDGIIPGSYDITATGAGFESTTVPGVEVIADETATVDFAAVATRTAFEISALDVPDAVQIGESLEASTTIANQGTASGTETVAVELLEADGDVTTSQTREITLDSGESTVLEETFDTAELDYGEYSVRVTVGETTQAAFLTLVEDHGGIETSITGVDSPVAVGAVSRVTVRLTNTRSTTVTRYVDLSVGGQVVDSRTVTVGPNAESTVVFTLGTTTFEPGDHEIQVRAGESTDTARIEVRSVPTFEIDDVEPIETVTQGQSARVTVRVRNTGNLKARQTVSVVVNSRTVAARSVTAGPGESRRLTLAWSTQGLSLGDYDVTITTDDDSATSTMTVRRPGRS